jgi:hypothetical protein
MWSSWGLERKDIIDKIRPANTDPYQDINIANIDGQHFTYANYWESGNIQLREIVFLNKYVPGQNNPYPVPYLDNHKVVYIGDKVYDPSYGRTFGKAKDTLRQPPAGYFFGFVRSDNNADVDKLSSDN